MFKEMKAAGLSKTEIVWEVIGGASVLIVPVILLLSLELFAK